MTKPTMGSLFAGIGGFDLGFERAGFEIKWQVEIDPWARKVLAKNFPHATRYEDVCEVGKHNLAPVDVICGGFPCQDISNAGLRAGITGKRSGLWNHACRIISELRPRVALLENVGALLAPVQRDTWVEPAAIARVLGDLSEIGYDAEWDIVSARSVGAPHLRERAWIVCYPQAQRCEEAGSIRHNESSEWFPRSSKTGFPAYLGEKRDKGIIEEEISWLSGFPWCKDVRRVEDLRGRSDIPEPLFRGSRDGVPNWVDRVGGLGNAVVPQIPEMYAQRIREVL